MMTNEKLMQAGVKGTRLVMLAYEVAGYEIAGFENTVSDFGKESEEGKEALEILHNENDLKEYIMLCVKTKLHLSQYKDLKFLGKEFIQDAVEMAMQVVERDY